MPQVGKKKFAYTKVGKKKAKMYAKKSKQKVKKGQIMMRFSGRANVNGNWKADAMKKAKQHIKTGKKFINKSSMSAAKTYGSYVAPTVGLFKGATNIATGIGKMALRNPLLAAGTYIAGKGFKVKGKYAKGKKFNEFGTAGKLLSKGGNKYI